MISFYISSYSFSTLFTKTDLPWLIFESIRALEIKTSRLFNLEFANNTILSRFFFFFLIIDFYFLIHAAIAQIFDPIEKLVIPIRIPIKEAKVEIEIHSVIVETKIRTCSI